MRPLGRGALRQDGPQRDRVRPDAGVCRGFRHHPQGAGRRTSPRTYRYDLEHRRHRRGLAARQRRRLVAARPDGDGARRETPRLDEYTGFVHDSGEGRWTIMAAIEEAVPADVLSTLALRPVPLAAGAHVRGEGALGHAEQVRRPRRTACRGADGRRPRRTRRVSEAAPCPISHPATR